MSLLSFHFSRGTNGKGSWFIVWLKKHWKEPNFPSEDCQNTKNQSAFGVGKSWSSLLPIIHMEHGLCNSQGWERRTPAEDVQWVGPRPWLCKELALLNWLGWKGSAAWGGPCPSLSSQRHFPWTVSQWGPRKGSLVPGFSENEFTQGYPDSQGKVEGLRLRFVLWDRRDKLQRKISTVFLGCILRNAVSWKCFAFPHLPVCIWVGNTHLPTPAQSQQPHLAGCSALQHSRAAEWPWCVLQWCKALWLHSSGPPFLPVSTPKSSYPFASPLGNELVTSEAPSPDASFVPGKQQLSRYQAWSFERLLKEGIKRNPVTLCLSLISRNPKPSTHLSQSLPLLRHWFAVCKGTDRQTDRPTSPRLPLAAVSPYQAQSSWEQVHKDKHEADQFGSSEDKPVNKLLSTNANSLRVPSVLSVPQVHNVPKEGTVGTGRAGSGSVVLLQMPSDSRHSAEKQDL